MVYIRNTHTGGVAFTATNCPGFTEEEPADKGQLEAHAEVMNERAVNLDLEARYEVAER